MKFCPNCGNKLNGNESKCPKCGLVLNKKQPKENKQDHDIKEILNKVDSTRFKDLGRQHKKLIIGIVCAIVAVIVVYSQIYVPHVVDSALENNGFTSAKGYKVNVNRGNKMITLTPNFGSQQQINSQLESNGFDTRVVTAESQMSNVAHEIAGKTFGKWTVRMTAENVHTRDYKLAYYWVFKGAKETTRFQTSPVGQEFRRHYLQQKEDEANEEDKEHTDDVIAAGALGGALGFMAGAW